MGRKRDRDNRMENMVEGTMEEHSRKKRNCVLDAVLSIKKAQDQAENITDCENDCFNNLLSPTANNGLDTVPITLQTKDGKFFFATGAIGRVDCFQTVFFRVEKVDEKNGCATLSLLRPDVDIEFDDCCVDPTSLCEIDELERTRFCIEVDLDCFCAIQCLDPQLLEGVMDKHHHCK